MKAKNSISGSANHGFDISVSVPTPDDPTADKTTRRDGTSTVSAIGGASAGRATVTATAAALPTAGPAAVSSIRSNGANPQHRPRAAVLAFGTKKPGNLGKRANDFHRSRLHGTANSAPIPKFKVPRFNGGPSRTLGRPPSRVPVLSVATAIGGSQSLAAGGASSGGGSRSNFGLTVKTNTPSASAGHAAAAAASTSAPSSEFALQPIAGGSTAAAANNGSGSADVDINNTIYSKLDRDGLLRAIQNRNKRISDPRLLLSTEGESDDMIRSLVADDRIVNAGTIPATVPIPTTKSSSSRSSRSRSLNDEEEDTENGGNAPLNSPTTARRTTGAAGGHGGGRTGLGLPKDDRLYDDEDCGSIGEAITTSSPPTKVPYNPSKHTEIRRPRSLTADVPKRDGSGTKEVVVKLRNTGIELDGMDPIRPNRSILGRHGRRKKTRTVQYTDTWGNGGGRKLSAMEVEDEDGAISFEVWAAAEEKVEVEDYEEDYVFEDDADVVAARASATWGQDFETAMHPVLPTSAGSHAAGATIIQRTQNCSYSRSYYTQDEGTVMSNDELSALTGLLPLALHEYAKRGEIEVGGKMVQTPISCVSLSVLRTFIHPNTLLSGGYASFIGFLYVEVKKFLDGVDDGNIKAPKGKREAALFGEFCTALRETVKVANEYWEGLGIDPMVTNPDLTLTYAGYTAMNIHRNPEKKTGRMQQHLDGGLSKSLHSFCLTYTESEHFTNRRLINGVTIPIQFGDTRAGGGAEIMTTGAVMAGSPDVIWRYTYGQSLNDAATGIVSIRPRKERSLWMEIVLARRLYGDEATLDDPSVHASFRALAIGKFRVEVVEMAVKHRLMADGDDLDLSVVSLRLFHQAVSSRGGKIGGKASAQRFREIEETDMDELTEEDMELVLSRHDEGGFLGGRNGGLLARKASKALNNNLSVSASDLEFYQRNQAENDRRQAGTVAGTGMSVVNTSTSSNQIVECRCGQCPATRFSKHTIPRSEVGDRNRPIWKYEVDDSGKMIGDPVTLPNLEAAAKQIKASLNAIRPIVNSREEGGLLPAGRFLKANGGKRPPCWLRFVPRLKNMIVTPRCQDCGCQTHPIKTNLLDRVDYVPYKSLQNKLNAAKAKELQELCNELGIVVEAGLSAAALREKLNEHYNDDDSDDDNGDE